MDNEKKYDFLKELTPHDLKEYKKVAKKYPVLDKSAQKRILDLCEEKMAMRNNDDFYKHNEVNEPVETVKKTPWYHSRILTVAASFVLVAGLGVAAFAGLSRVNDDTVPSTDLPFSTHTSQIEPTTDNLKRNTDAELNQEKARELMYALDFVDRFGGNGGDIGYDMNKFFYDADEQLYVKVVESGFSCTDDVRSYMAKYMTESYISEHYSGFFGNYDPILTDVDVNGKNVLYSKYSPKGCGFQWTETVPTIEKQTDGMYIILAEYYNYGVTDTMVITVIRDSVGNWKIENTALKTDSENLQTSTTETSAIVTALEKSATESVVMNTENPIISSDKQYITDELSTNAVPTTTVENPTEMPTENIEITQSMANDFLYAFNLIDRFGGCGIQYDENQYINISNDEVIYRVTEQGFNTTQDVADYMKKYMTQSYIAERYSGLLGNYDPVLTDIDMGGWYALYTRYCPKACGFQWTGKESVIEKHTDDMYTILAEYYNFGVVDTMTIEIIRDTDGNLKINMVTFGL